MKKRKVISENAAAPGSAGILPAWQNFVGIAFASALTSVFFPPIVVAADARNAEIISVRQSASVVETTKDTRVSIRVEGRKIIVTRAAHETSVPAAHINYKIKGVCYSNDANGLTFYENFDRDLELLKTIHANSIRTFRPFAAYKEGTETVELDYEKTKHMLDKLAEAGITVTVGFDSARDIVGGRRDDATGRVYREAFYLEYINAFATHPAVLAWAFGNEYNYKYNDWFGGDKGKWLAILAGAVKNAKAASPRPAAVVHGELPSEAELREYENIPGLDLIMLNVYRGPGFGALYKDWKTRTRALARPMPLVLSEFGRSSVDGKGGDTSALQAAWLEKMWAEIEANFVGANEGAGAGAGGYVFSLKDEAWKGDSDSGPNIGVENHLGLFTEDGQPKPAARLLMRIWKDGTDK